MGLPRSQRKPRGACASEAGRAAVFWLGFEASTAGGSAPGGGPAHPGTGARQRASQPGRRPSHRQVSGPLWPAGATASRSGRPADDLALPERALAARAQRVTATKARAAEGNRLPADSGPRAGPRQRSAGERRPEDPAACFQALWGGGGGSSLSGGVLVL